VLVFISGLCVCGGWGGGEEEDTYMYLLHATETVINNQILFRLLRSNGHGYFFDLFSHND